jgi:hypothetical protein
MLIVDADKIANALDYPCHRGAGMIQITHLGRRTSWSKGDWLPVIAPSTVREPAHRAFPKVAEDWDIARIVGQYADAADAACRRADERDAAQDRGRRHRPRRSRGGRASPRRAAMR